MAENEEYPDLEEIKERFENENITETFCEIYTLSENNQNILFPSNPLHSGPRTTNNILQLFMSLGLISDSSDGYVLESKAKELYNIIDCKSCKKS